MVECCDNELTKRYVKQQMTYKNHKFETICMTKVVTNCQKWNDKDEMTNLNERDNKKWQQNRLNNNDFNWYDSCYIAFWNVL